MSPARRVVVFSAGEALPAPEDVLLSWGLPEVGALSERTRHTLDDALGLLAALGEPRALFEPLTRDEFTAVYRASSPEQDDTPPLRVAARADALALFAATLGEALTHRTRELFARHEPGLAYLLDAAASVAADRLASLTAASFAGTLGTLVDGATRVLPYSPGYCGWPTAGQRALFERLRPEEIGLSLNASCLMWPLKSVSGLLAAGPLAAHAFPDDFPFCTACATHACRTRLATLGASAWTV